jgi:hypothetical protein
MAPMPRFKLRTLPDEKQSWLTVFALSSIMLSPLAYLLSVGPFVWLFKHGYITQGTYQNLHLLYKPLLIFRDNCEPFRWAMDWYISWFQ